jgi:tRNA 2-thiouridine synthesizing protein A
MTEPLDLTGLLCPLPVLKARKALAALPAGAALVVLADDPMARVDMPLMARQDGHALLTVETRGDTLAFHLRKGG